MNFRFEIRDANVFDIFHFFVALSYGSLVRGIENTCPPGTYQPTTGQVCSLCPLGTYNPYEGADSCYYCGYGYYCDVFGGTSKKACPTGTYQPLRNATSVLDCIPCPVGTYNIESANTCYYCGYGYYCDILGGTSRKSCPAGTYQPLLSATSIYDCIPCPIGTYNIGSANRCYYCGYGYYCDIVGETSRKSCPAGTYQPLLNATSVYDCIPCPIGTYNIESANTCYYCGYGYYCDVIGGSSRKACPAGTYQPVRNATSVQDCLLCPAGTYQPYTGADSSRNCLPCSNGTYSQGDDRVRCIDSSTDRSSVRSANIA